MSELGTMLESINRIMDQDDNDIITDYTVTDAEESAIFLDRLLRECENEEEFLSLVNESKEELVLTGLLPSLEAVDHLNELFEKGNDDANISSEALETTKTIKIDNWKKVTISKMEKRRAIRIAQELGQPEYAKYMLHRGKMIEFRNKIYEKNMARAKKDVRMSLQNSRNKTQNLKSNSGKTINEKIENAIKKVDSSGRNHQAIKK